MIYFPWPRCDRRNRTWIKVSRDNLYNQVLRRTRYFASLEDRGASCSNGALAGWCRTGNQSHIRPACRMYVDTHFTFLMCNRTRQSASVSSDHRPIKCWYRQPNWAMTIKSHYIYHTIKSLNTAKLSSSTRRLNGVHISMIDGILNPPAVS